MYDFNEILRVDPEIADATKQEMDRQESHIELIASENFVSRAVMAAMGSPLTNKYAEGYPGKRYYGGCSKVDITERLAIDRAKALFSAGHANVQPHSGAQANMAVYFAFLMPGDTIMGMDLSCGGHLTHGSPVSISGKYFNIVPYGVDRATGYIDYEEMRRIASSCRPKLIIAGASSYSRVIDFAKCRAIADEVGAYLMVDMAHIAGLVATGHHPSPIGHAHIVTSTTHKTLRGPRGAMIMSTAEHASALDKAVFPGLQGGPHNHTTAAIAVALREAAEPEFRTYAHQVVANAKALATALADRGFALVSGGTDNHLILMDLTPKGIGGKPAAKALDRAGIEVNYNTVPFDPRKPFDPSGVRIGTPAITTRGLREEHMPQIAAWMDEAISAAVKEDDQVIERIAGEVRELLAGFPMDGWSEAP